MPTEYTLERTLPNGQVKTQGPTTRKGACGLAAYVLSDNAVTSKRDALTVARRLDHAADGAPVEAHGYTFRLIRAS